ncbi:hypothetical protein [Candidatus Sodalis pierantonius]|uniref:hypothetical protein n=1 Tax=Candidatus Sodalis pierantonii TaxID=1486991 RepID=UPI0011DC95F6|nr:hypothetical protein [Candidatus Sodalis pierantonius]
MNSLPAYFPDGPAITRNDIVPLATEVMVYDDLSAFASRICSVANCGLKMAVPICHNLCKLANKFPLVLNLLAAGVSLSIAFPSGASLPFFVATGMMVVGCQSGNTTVNSE